MSNKNDTIFLSNRSDFIRQSTSTQRDFKARIGWVILSPIEAQIKAKIELVGMALKDWDINIYRGILTGYNDAFIIDQKTKDELVEASPKNDGIIRPIIRGRDTAKYYANYSSDSLLFIPWHFPLQMENTIRTASLIAEHEFKVHYTEIYNHMLNFKTMLQQRNSAETGIRYEWYALQRFGSNYWMEFVKPKIVWKRVGSVLRFSYDETGAYCLDTACFATGQDLKFIVGYLNSSISKMELLKTSPQTGTGDIIVSVQALEPHLIPKATSQQKKEIEHLVDQCIYSVINQQIDVLINYEKKIDEIIFSMFNLTEDEKEYVISYLKENN